VKVLAVTEAVAIGEVEVDLLRTVAKLIFTPLRALLPLMSVGDTKGMDFASSATRRGTVSSNT
jgi:hypothetical protein